MPIERSISEVLEAHGEAIRRDIRKCVPATVTAVSAALQTVDVQIAINDVLYTDMGDGVDMGAASLANVPLGCLRGGGFFLWVPVAVGDSVLLIFSDASADTWRAGDGSPKPPGFAGLHTADSPFAIPMFAPDAKGLGSPVTAATKMMLGRDVATEQIRISDTAIELGSPAVDAVALASKVDAINTLLKAFATAMGAVPPAGPLAPLAAAITAATALNTGIVPTGSLLVKCG